MSLRCDRSCISSASSSSCRASCWRPAFVILGRAIAAQSLPGILLQLLADALFVFPWGLLAALVTLLLIASGGFFAQTRRAAGLFVALLGIGSFVVVLATILGHSRISVDDLPFFIPGIVATCIGLWIALGDRTESRHCPRGHRL